MSTRARRRPSIARIPGREIVDESMLRIGPAMSIPAVLRELGTEPVGVLKDFGLAVSFFDDPEHTIPMATLGRLFARCAERTSCDHFGLLVGQRAGISSLGALGFLAQSANSVGAALGLLAHDLNVQDRSAVVSVKIDGRFATLSYVLVHAEVDGMEQVLAAVMALAANIMRGLSGPQWQPSELRLAFSRPGKVEPYQRFFGVRPRFDAEQSALIFPARALRDPLPAADPLLHKFMADRVRELRLRAEDHTVAKLRRLLRVMITSPDCSLETVAKRMGIHGRTLNRELAAESTTFRQLREEVRRDAACQLLENTRTPINEIASIVGYGDPSCFTRAFQRWTGLGPARWRAARSA